MLFAYKRTIYLRWFKTQFFTVWTFDLKLAQQIWRKQLSRGDSLTVYHGIHHQTKTSSNHIKPTIWENIGLLGWWFHYIF